MDPIIQHFPLTIQVRKASSFLGVGEHGIVFHAKATVYSTLGLVGFQHMPKFGHGGRQVAFTHSFRAEFILVDPSCLQTVDSLRFPPFGLVLESRGIQTPIGGFDHFGFADDVCFAT